jgi:hypothetical protein
MQEKALAISGIQHGHAQRQAVDHCRQHSDDRGVEHRVKLGSFMSGAFGMPANPVHGGILADPRADFGCA